VRPTIKCRRGRLGKDLLLQGLVGSRVTEAPGHAGADDLYIYEPTGQMTRWTVKRLFAEIGQRAGSFDLNLAESIPRLFYSHAPFSGVQIFTRILGRLSDLCGRQTRPNEVSKARALLKDIKPEV